MHKYILQIAQGIMYKNYVIIGGEDIHSICILDWTIEDN